MHIIIIQNQTKTKNKIKYKNVIDEETTRKMKKLEEHGQRIRRPNSSDEHSDAEHLSAGPRPKWQRN
jgi:hypothetical protein